MSIVRENLPASVESGGASSSFFSSNDMGCFPRWMVVIDPIDFQERRKAGPALVPAGVTSESSYNNRIGFRSSPPPRPARFFSFSQMNRRARVLGRRLAWSHPEWRLRA